jgi:hypothetical protein
VNTSDGPTRSRDWTPGKPRISTDRTMKPSVGDYGRGVHAITPTH